MTKTLSDYVTSFLSSFVEASKGPVTENRVTKACDALEQRIQEHEKTIESYKATIVALRALETVAPEQGRRGEDFLSSDGSTIACKDVRALVLPMRFEMTKNAAVAKAMAHFRLDTSDFDNMARFATYTSAVFSSKK